MTPYENLLDEAHEEGLTVHEVPFVDYDGLIRNRRIGIRKTIKSSRRKADILAEEISHHKYTVGNILDQRNRNNRHQERIARFHAYNKRIGLDGIVRAYEHGCRNRYEVAEYLEVSEPFLEEAIACYREKYGTHKKVGNHIVIFEPYIGVIRFIGKER